MLEQYGAWGGWSVAVEGPGGTYVPPAVPGAVVPFTDGDLIRLAPGESAGVLLRLGGYQLLGTHAGGSPQPMAGTPGPYTVRVTYEQAQDKVPSSKGGFFVPVDKLPTVESNGLKLTVSGWKLPR